ncbi:hypothetical protein GII30_21445 [Gordonia amarae]|uniref:Condensation domain-containing protein n=2 Tax=Gordonia amarae TaxID=36821 RepID=G7GW67_9ACTN|nr:hypothetical protein [Gordonia amarae]MCS3881011.1 hypothetical protein [Gordonia amarae]QHN19246.1 hypothetical protein GII35_21740 [Gordonia amarae]QHN23722.1 hypothetical protein GII34_21240 [Gordonia amarae]QHN32634.1 hypothetical protein GII32_21570 [Gordonia amarae]QHN41382.1 hypothetical protein GII30_21445 [Gordonia amarae]
MHVTTIDLVMLSGAFTELCTHWTGEPVRRQLAVTFNQANHLLGLADPTSQGVWIAGTVDLADDGEAVDTERAAHAVARFLTEHEALRARFQFDPQTSVPYADVFGPNQVRVTAEPRGDIGSADLATLLSARCRSGEVPGVFFGLLDSTLIVGFDHAHCDALTVDLALRRIRELYLDPESRRSPGERFFDRSELDGILSEKLAAAEGEHPRLPAWRRFFAATGNAIPTFPLPLGEIPPGGAPQCTRVVELLDDTAADALGRGAFAKILAQLAASIADQGGPQTLSTVIPVHTRGRSSSRWHQTAGWLVTNAPVRVRSGDTGGAQRALKSALGLAAVPLDHVLQRCQPAMTTADIFMVSYLDYRRLGDPLPGARHISNSTTTDSVQMWFSRHHDGLDLRIRYPDTTTANATVDALVLSLSERLRRYADAAHPATA